MLDVTFSVAIDSSRTTITLTDDTVYGGSNPARNALAVYLNAYKMNYDNEATTLTVTSDDSSPLTDSEWSYSYDNGDGWYKHYYVAIPFYNSGTSYSQYDAVYSSGVVYRSLVNSNVGNSVSNTNYWEVISDPASLANNKDQSNESQNINSLVYQRVFTSNSQYAYGNLIREQCACTDCDEDELLQSYAIFSILVNGAVTCDERTEVLSGELICRKIQARFIDNAN